LGQVILDCAPFFFFSPSGVLILDSCPVLLLCRDRAGSSRTGGGVSLEANLACCALEGCIQWFLDLVDTLFVDGGQDLYVRLAKSELGH